MNVNRKTLTSAQYKNNANKGGSAHHVVTVALQDPLGQHQDGTIKIGTTKLAHMQRWHSVRATTICAYREHVR